MRVGSLSASTAAGVSGSVPPFVGRAEEVRRINAAVARVANGQGCAFFLMGQAGIGKTRLAREALASAREQGFQVLEGRAYHFERGLAYGLILDAFGPFLRNLGPVCRSALVSGLDDLGRLFSTLRLPTPEPLGDPSLEKTRLFEAVARLLDRLARSAPVVVFLDDLHWADPASLELLHYLARGIAEQPVLLLATYRDDEADAARGLRALLNSLQRSSLAALLTLAPLGPQAVEELAQGILGGEVPGELHSILAARAGGTPFFVEGLIRAFVDSGQLVRTGDEWAFKPGPSAALPPVLRDLILERLEQLGPTDRQLVNLIAVSGDAAPHGLLRVASDQSEEMLLAGLSRLMGASLVVEEHDGPEVAYGLSQALIQEVAYSELPEMARRQAHAAFVDALEALRPVDLDRLARHYRGAGPQADQDRALIVLLAAAERARSLYANNEAAQHFGAALALVRLGRRAELLPSLLESLGEAWEQVGEGAAGIAVWAEALAEFERHGDFAGVARLRRRLSMAEWDRGHFAVAQAHLSAGLQALAGHEPTQELADLIHARVIVLARLDDSRGAEAAASELLDIANQLASPRTVVEAHLAQAGSRLQRGEYDAAREHAWRGLSTAEAAGELLLAQRAYDGLSLVAWVLGDHRLSRTHAEQSLALAQRLGAPTLELLPINRLIFADLMAGDWDQARRRSGAALTSARRVGQPRGLVGALGMRAMVLAQQGDLDEADACIVEARRVFGVESTLDRHVFVIADFAEVIIALERGDAARALAVTAEWSSSLVNRFPLGLALAAEAQAASGAAERALQTAHELARFGPPDNLFVAALAARAEGLAKQALGDVESATAGRARAAEGFARVEMPFEAARARLEWAALTVGVNSRAATSAARESLAVFERLGAQRYARRARQMLHRLGVHPPTARRARPGEGSLSARELEVARLVAEGLSNAEIAERLVISPRTVTSHLNRMYARLGINSRAALARYVAEAGLLPSADQNT
jgi:DNA-binding CsgD family transcriptional regulator